MSLPTSKTSQTSIRAFFQPKPPNYAPPPSQNVKQAVPPPPTVTAPTTSAPPPPATAAAAAAVAAPPPATAQPAPSPPVPVPAPHPQASIRPVTAAHIPALRRINALLLPVSYPDSFYNSVLDPAASALFSRVITWTDPPAGPNPSPDAEKVIGGIVCRIETLTTHPAPTPSSQLLQEHNHHHHHQEQEQQQEEHALYIQSLCLLSPYRSLGLASAALDQILAVAARDPSLNVRLAYAHVWTENDDGLRWYTARGFAKEGPAVDGYYLKLRPNTAWVVRRDVVLPSIRGALAEKMAAPAQGSEMEKGKESQGIIQPTPVHVPQSTTAAVANLSPSTAGNGMGGPPRGPIPSRTPPTRTTSGQSYQNQRPEMEWNDLPADMAPGSRPNGSGPSSGQSSRSSSAVRKKRDRAYPTTPFGS